MNKAERKARIQRRLEQLDVKANGNEEGWKILATVRGTPAGRSYSQTRRRRPSHHKMTDLG